MNLPQDARIKLTLTVVGIAIWAFGAKSDSVAVRWVGIGMIAAAFILRFVKRRE